MIGYCLNCATDSAPMHLCSDLCWQCCEHGVEFQAVLALVVEMIRQPELEWWDGRLSGNEVLRLDWR